jgi:hypothetical protein
LDFKLKIPGGGSGIRHAAAAQICRGRRRGRPR